MTMINYLLIAAGVLAFIYGALLLWTAANAKKDVKQDDWLTSDEVTRSKYNTLNRMKYLHPERPGISFSRSKTRGYAMMAIGIVLIVFGVT